VRAAVTVFLLVWGIVNVIMALIAATTAAGLFVATGGGVYLSLGLVWFATAGACLIEIDNERECWDE